MYTLYSCTARSASRTSASPVARQQYRMSESKRPSAPCTAASPAQHHAQLHHPVSTMHSCITRSAPCTAASPGQHHAQLHHPVSTMHSCMTCCRGAVQTVNIRSERPLSSCTVASPWKWEGGECSRDCQSHVSMAVSDLDSCMHGHGEGGSNIGMARAQATAAGGHRAYRTRAY